MKEKIINILKSNLTFFMLLTIVVFALYGKSINFSYTNHDDISLIRNNISFISDTKNIPKLFTTSCFYSNTFQYYRPILTLTFSIEAILFGENLKVVHFVNLILFLLSLYLMYIFLLKLKLNETILKFLILIITVHPVFTINAVWIPARNDLLLIVFLLVSFISFVKYCEINKNIYMLFSFIFWILALFTKETAIISLFIYLYLAYWFNIKLTKKQLVIYIFSIIFILLCLFYLRSVSVTKVYLSYYITNFNEYLFNVFNWTAIYLKHFVFPIYMPTMLYKIQINILVIIINLFVVLMLIFLAQKSILNKNKIYFGLLYFFVFLIPTYFMYDCLLMFHRLFLPILGIIIILEEIISKILLKYEILKKYLIIFTICLFFIFSYASNIQADKYFNISVYWENAYNDAPNYHVACLFKSIIEFEKKNYKESEKLIRKAMEYNPKLYYCQLGMLMFETKQYDNAEELFFNSIKYNIDVGTSYQYISKIYNLKNDKNKAIEYAKLAIKYEPYNNSYKEYLKMLEQNY